MDRAPFVFVGPGDTLSAVSGNRLLRFDSNLHPVGTIRLAHPIQSGMAFLPDGRLVINGRNRLNATTISPVSILDSNGELLRSLEAIPVESAVGATLVSESSSGGFWLLRSNESEIEEISPDGSRESSVEVQREWFQPWTDFLPGEGQSVRPRPYNSSISEFSTGVVLIAAWMADREWEPTAPSGGTGMVAFRPAETDLSETWDTIIEVVDVWTGEVLASLRTPEAFSKVHGAEDLLFSAREESDGHVAIEIWRVELVSLR